MKYVDIKSLKPGDVLYKRNTGEACEILEITRDQCPDIKAARAYTLMLRFRFWGFDVFAPAMCKMFMGAVSDNMVATKSRGCIL